MSMNLKKQIAFAAALLHLPLPRGIIKQYEAVMEAKRQRDIYLIQLANFTGKTRAELEGYSDSFKISIGEMHYYYCAFCRLPEPEYIIVIRHIGVENLVNAVIAGDYRLSNSFSQ